MKKEYKKPEIMFESFALSTNIAACGFQASHAAALGSACQGYPVRGLTGMTVVFTSPLTGCETDSQEGIYNGYCYHVPTISLNLLNS